MCDKDNYTIAAWTVALSAAAYVFGRCYDNEKNYLPNHFLSFRLPWCQRKIENFTNAATQHIQKGQIDLTLHNYKKILELEPYNKFYRVEKLKLENLLQGSSSNKI